ncbi:unnamed protein product [Lathyrus sativus]|nr:unnamed protein product [Lathyrus sativus]
MRNYMERFVVLPFSLRCASHSSVELGEPKESKEYSKDSIVSRRKEGQIVATKMEKKRSSGFFVLPKAHVAAGIQRLIKGIKNFSQLFFYKDPIEEIEQDMEIGYPTDVKHVTHIGLDGSTTTNNVKGWDNLKPPELLSLNPITLKQFELAMATQAQQPLIDDSFPKCD